MQRIKLDLRKNISFQGTKRKEFQCLEINIDRESKFMKRTLEYAQKILPNLNLGAANSSESREKKVVVIDNLSGIIAEMACKEVLGWRYGKDKILPTSGETGRNQIDIMLYNEKTIEVRSSCVKNGLDFALFARESKESERQYFDVIGPYTNGYKHEELYKDYYMRVLYECDKMKFLNLLEHPSLRLYITGGATRAMMQDNNYYQIKHLLPRGGQVQTESDYRVIPLAKSLDIEGFFSFLEAENEELINKHKKYV